MVLTVQSCLDQIEHSLGGALSTQLDPIGIINEAGQYLVDMHDWVWLDRPPVSLDFRAEISVLSSVATVQWHDGNHRLKQVGAFTNYTWLDGDSIVISGGSGLPYGRFPVVAKVSSDEIQIGWTYDPAGGPGYTTVTNFVGVVKTDSIALPSDMGNIIDIQPTQGLVNSFNLTDVGFINQLRTNEVAVGNFRYWGAVTRGKNFTHTGQASSGTGAWRLEIYPTPTSTEYNALTMYYRAGWRPVTDDTDLINIPQYCESLMRMIVRSFARGYEEDDVASIHARLQEIQQSPMFVNARRRDGDIQPTLGQMSGGAVAQYEKQERQYLKSSVLGPS
jgi:hypothetical protein